MTTMLITMIVMIFRARSCTRHLGKAFFSQRVIDGFSFNFITSSLVSFPIYGFKTKKHNCFQHPSPALIKTIKCILYITSILIRCATSSYSDAVDRNVQHRCSASTSCVRLYINHLKLQLLMKVRVMITTKIMMKRLYLKVFLIE